MVKPDAHRHRDHARRRLVHRSARALPARQRRLRRRGVGRRHHGPAELSLRPQQATCARRSPATPTSTARPKCACSIRCIPTSVRPNSADVVLTFRNAHNWVEDGNAEAYFKAFFDVLKPGGTLGFVDHRAKPGTDLPNADEERLPHRGPGDRRTRRPPASCSMAKSEVNANPARHDRSPERRVDAAADQPARRGGRRAVQGDRRKRSHDAALREARGLIAPAQAARHDADRVQQALRGACAVHRPQRAAAADARGLRPAARTCTPRAGSTPIPKACCC